MKIFVNHARAYILRGFLAIIPIFLCVLAVQLLYNLIDKKVIGYISKFVEIRHIPGLGILLLLISLYFIGMIVSNIVGRQIFQLIERVTARIPFLKSVYSVGKQLSQGLSITNEETKAFKKAVLVHIDNTGLWAPAFVTGEVYNARTGEKMVMVLLPTSPTPASGFVFAVKQSQVIDPGWSVEECLKVLISVGIITPKEIKE